MKTFLNTCAIVALSAALLGCATTDTATTTTTPTPGSLTAMPADLEAALRQAQVQRRNKDYEGASHTLSQLVLVAPDDPRVIAEYGKTLAAQGRTDDAIAFLQRAIQLKENDWTLYSALGVAYDQKGNHRNAQQAYLRALSIKPGEPSVLSNAALSHLQQGDIATARRLLQQAAKNGGTDPKIAQNLAFVESIDTSSPARPAASAAVRPQAQPAKPAATASAAPHPQATPTRTASATAPAKPSTTPAATHAPAAKPSQAQPERTASAAPAVLRRGD